MLAAMAIRRKLPGGWGSSSFGPRPPRWTGIRLVAGAVTLWLLLGVGLVGWLVEWRLRENIERWTVQQVTTVATRAVVAAMAEAARSGTDALAAYRTDRDGHVVAVDYNWPAIHAVAARAAQAVRRWLEGASTQEVSIPFGEITGLRTLGGRGPGVRIRLVSAGAFEVEPFSEFYAAGFNQTVHRLGVTLRVRVLVVAPLVGQAVTVQARVPLAENQLLGQVPGLLLMPQAPGGSGTAMGGAGLGAAGPGR